MSLLLLAGLYACTPTADLGDDDSAGDSDSGDTQQEADLDPLSNDQIPDGYVPDALARVIFLGDSITDGSGASKNKLTYVSLLQDNDDETWPQATWLDLPDLLGAEPEIVDEARGGATTSSLVNGQLESVADDLGDTVSGQTAVVMTIAGNDVQGLIMNADETDQVIADVTENLAATYDFFQDPVRFPDGAWIYLANVYEPSDGVGQAEECFYGLNLADVLDGLIRVNDATRAQAADYGVGWLDLHGHFLGHGFYAEDSTNPYYHANDPTLWFASDCIHPNDRGHHEIRRMFWYALAGLPFPGDGADVP